MSRIVSKDKYNELRKAVSDLQDEYEYLYEKITEFEYQIRAELINEMIEEQELMEVYRNLKKAKKAKRLEQKKRGKNYVPPQDGTVPSNEPVAVDEVAVKEEKTSRRKLYRAAMLKIHPDNFNGDDQKVEAATLATSQLIDAYNNATIEDFTTFCNSIHEDNYAFLEGELIVQLSDEAKYEALEQAHIQLLVKMRRLQKRHTFTVLETYDNPDLFLGELKAYYVDRIAKLKKRTRKAFK